jgi:hypothetical protein
VVYYYHPFLSELDSFESSSQMPLQLDAVQFSRSRNNHHKAVY